MTRIFIFIGSCLGFLQVSSVFYNCDTPQKRGVVYDKNSLNNTASTRNSVEIKYSKQPCPQYICFFFAEDNVPIYTHKQKV